MKTNDWPKALDARIQQVMKLEHLGHADKALVGIAFIAAIVAANWLTSHYGMIPVGFGLVATAGTYLAGLTFILRDAVQDASGKRAALLLIIIGALISWALADPRIALASCAAFLVGELADFAVYTPLRRHGYVRAAIASNTVGAFLDTLLFLWIAGFPIVGAWQGQILAKLTVTAAAVGGLVVLRAVFRKPVYARGA